MAKKPHDEPEWLTRKTRIDGKLRALGWSLVPHTDAFQPAAHPQAVTEYPTASGPADYALFVGGRMLGIVEAKKLSLGPQNVLTQAQRSPPASPTARSTSASSASRSCSPRTAK